MLSEPQMLRLVIIDHIMRCEAHLVLGKPIMLGWLRRLEGSRCLRLPDTHGQSFLRHATGVVQQGGAPYQAGRHCYVIAIKGSLSAWFRQRRLHGFACAERD